MPWRHSVICHRTPATPAHRLTRRRAVCSDEPACDVRVMQPQPPVPTRATVTPWTPHQINRALLVFVSPWQSFHAALLSLRLIVRAFSDRLMAQGASRSSISPSSLHFLLLRARCSEKHREKASFRARNRDPMDHPARCVQRVRPFDALAAGYSPRRIQRFC
jgi:hypothetical protein